MSESAKRMGYLKADETWERQTLPEGFDPTYNLKTELSPHWDLTPEQWESLEEGEHVGIPDENGGVTQAWRVVGFTQLKDERIVWVKPVSPEEVQDEVCAGADTGDPQPGG